MSRNSVPVRCWVTVTAEPSVDRVLLRVAGLTLPLLPEQARGIADQLHDAADQLESQ